jgi:hypothetical protein
MQSTQRHGLKNVAGTPYRQQALAPQAIPKYRRTMFPLLYLSPIQCPANASSLAQPTGT